MGKLVEPQTFLIGYTGVDRAGLTSYLRATDQVDFLATFDAALADGLSEGEALCSFYAKLCYKSLKIGKNANITRTRDIAANIAGAFDQGHGSVFEHFGLNFVVTDCSRVFTHELVRHRIGTAFSQTSGRYCRLDSIDLVWDPILAGCEDLVADHLAATEVAVYLMECKKGLRVPPTDHPKCTANDCLSDSVPGFPEERRHLRWVPDARLDFDFKKKVTSAIRRIAPNGQSNEIGFSINVRALRQVVQVRTAPGAEREIRLVFNQVYALVRAKFPTIFHGARTKEVDGLLSVYGMKTQPYELVPGDPAALQFLTAEQIRAGQ